jgi:hypothetical protein
MDTDWKAGEMPADKMNFQSNEKIRRIAAGFFIYSSLNKSVLP